MEHAKRGLILFMVFAFLVSSLGLSGFVIWQIVKDGKKSENDKTAERLQNEINQKKATQQEGSKVSEPLDGYSATPFNKDDVKELKVEVLKEGAGATATANSTVKVNYFGWTSDGKIFDSSKKNGAAPSPIEFPLSGVIKGWTDGLTGVKAGSTVRLTIPGAQAYGDTDTGTGRPFGPLAFVVEVIEVK
jgi:FKBP-type peptidyl-prolyl cis-trans isomerase FkpA